MNTDNKEPAAKRSKTLPKWTAEIFPQVFNEDGDEDWDGKETKSLAEWRAEDYPPRCNVDDGGYWKDKRWEERESYVMRVYESALLDKIPSLNSVRM